MRVYIATTLEERFWKYVAPMTEGSGCWEWMGHIAGHGYGRITSGRRPATPLYAHRVSYEINVGTIPDEFTIDHLCRNRSCVNPAHLEVVTMGTNTLRGEGPTAENKRKSNCQNDHALAGENLIVDKRGYRKCRTCRDVYMRAYRATRKEARH